MDSKNDPNLRRKAMILFRLRRIKNSKVAKYVRGDVIEKIDGAGEHAGVWLEALESSFSSLAGKPQGLLKDFQEQDFKDLFQALYGYERPA